MFISLFYIIENFFNIYQVFFLIDEYSHNCKLLIWMFFDH